ncbi:MAG: hypothetical protein H7345_04655 [Rubritepida sp.]|nr:hypothetical protein [Rubritepida sp.]
MLAFAALLLGASALIAPQVAEARVGHGVRAADAPHAATRPAHRVTRAQAGRRHHARSHRRSQHASRRVASNTFNAAYVPVAAGSLASTTQFQGSPRAACLDATRRAELAHGIPAGLLTAIALSESGLHAYAMNIGGRAVFPEAPEAAASLLRAASGRDSVMAGCLQVNARVHARGETWPLDARLSADWGGALLARWGQDYGWADALRRWHGGSVAATPRLVCRVRAKLDVTQPGSTLFNEFNCNASREDRTRRNAEAHFTIATIDSL